MLSDAEHTYGFFDRPSDSDVGPAKRGCVEGSAQLQGKECWTELVTEARYDAKRVQCPVETWRLGDTVTLSKPESTLFCFSLPCEIGNIAETAFTGKKENIPLTIFQES